MTNITDKNNDIHKEIAALKEDLAALTKQITGITKDKLSDIKAKGKEISSDVEDSAYKLGARAREAFEGAEDNLKYGAKYLESQAKSHPLITLGAAFIIGMLIEKLGSRKD
jgi:ElaB/YqjD/DUF883 family membrane-anchored ribosome-binding protein